MFFKRSLSSRYKLKYSQMKSNHGWDLPENSLASQTEGGEHACGAQGDTQVMLTAFLVPLPSPSRPHPQITSLLMKLTGVQIQRKAWSKQNCNWLTIILFDCHEIMLGFDWGLKRINILPFILLDVSSYPFQNVLRRGRAGASAALGAAGLRRHGHVAVLSKVFVFLR